MTSWNGGGIVSTWGLANSKGYGGWVKDDFMCINLGSGRLRGPASSGAASSSHCINLKPGQLRGRINAMAKITMIVSTWELPYEDFTNTYRASQWYRVSELI